MNTYYGDFQTKVMNHYVRLLQTDSYLMTKVAGRVYPQHVSLIENPKFPSISFTRQGLGGDPSFPEIDYPFLIIDVWSKVGPQELWSIYASRDPKTNRPVGIRALVANKGFDLPEAVVELGREVWVSDDLYEAWSKTFHLSSKYILTIAAKRLVVT